MVLELIKKCRSYRRFRPEPISRATVLGLLDGARLSASAGNLQPLRYVLILEPEARERVFSCLKWAAYLKDWPGPSERERPQAYIVVLGDRRISKKFSFDAGVAVQNTLLLAIEQGLGGCVLGSIDRKALGEFLRLDENYEIIVVVALGRPAEKVVIEEVGPDGDIKYWRDSHGVHHVPKRRLEDLILTII
ncbi:nitroreductase family protein [Thermosulfuriphilus sp.]